MCGENRIASQYQNCWPGIVNTSATKPNLEKLCTHFVTQVSKQPPCEQNQLFQDVDVQHFNCVKKVHKITGSPGRSVQTSLKVFRRKCPEQFWQFNLPGPHDVCKRNQCWVSLRHYLVDLSNISASEKAFSSLRVDEARKWRCGTVHCG